MKYLFIYFLVISCSSSKLNKDELSFLITNDSVRDDSLISLIIINKFSKNIFFYTNNNFEVCELTDCNFNKNCLSKIIIENEYENAADVNGFGYDLSNNLKISLQKLEASKGKLYSIKPKDTIKLSLPLYFNYVNRVNGNTANFKFYKGTKYYVRIEYVPTKKIIDSLKGKGIKIYDKEVLSNKVPIIFE